jgi:hypothetical protein
MAILYTRISEVKNRLLGKVEFTEDPEETRCMSEQLLQRLIQESESEVELDLSHRYEAPFTHCDGTGFDALPDRPTKEILRTLCELNSVWRVLDTDFGMGGGSVNSEGYTKQVRSRYEKLRDRIIARRNDDDDQNQYKYPPLPMLKLSYHNTEADDGFRGMILTTNDGNNSMDYPSRRINDPSQSYFTVLTDGLDDL